jgi:hypothetical protein
MVSWCFLILLAPLIIEIEGAPSTQGEQNVHLMLLFFFIIHPNFCFNLEYLNKPEQKGKIYDAPCFAQKIPRCLL